MPTPATTAELAWHQRHPARGILARLTAAGVFLVAVTPIVGERSFRWSAAEQHERLEAARKAAVEEGFGHTFAWAAEQGRTRDYLAFDATVPSVGDVLAERFGNPARFGFPAHGGISAADTANALWRAEQAAEQKADAA